MSRLIDAAAAARGHALRLRRTAETLADREICRDDIDRPDDSVAPMTPPPRAALGAKGGVTGPIGNCSFDFIANRDYICTAYSDKGYPRVPNRTSDPQPRGMSLVIERRATRGMLAVPNNLRDLLRRRLDAIAADPFNRELNDGPYNEGGKDCFKVRQGGWRAIYVIDRKAQEVRVKLVEPRGRVYR